VALEDQFKEEDVQEIEAAHDRVVAEHERAEQRRYGYWGWVEDIEDIDWGGF
jgi:hypothetical protein